MFAAASLVITSETMKSAYLTQYLDLEPTQVHEKGTRMSKRNPKSQLYLKMIWSLQSDLPQDRPLSDHIFMLLSEIESRASRLTSLTETCDLFFFCSLSHDNDQESSRLDHLLWQRLARLPAPVVLDLYPPTIDDEEAVYVGTSQKWTTAFFEARSETTGSGEFASMRGPDPAEVRVRAEAVGPEGSAAKAESTTTAWRFDSGLATSALLEDHVAALLDKVEEHADTLSILTPSRESYLILSFASDNGQGGGWFSHELVERIAHASIDMLIYLVPPFLDNKDPATEAME